MSTARNNYIYGSAVRKPVYEPEHEERRAPRRQSRPVSRRVRRNRRRARSVGAGYTLFLLATAMVVLLVCVSYIKVQVGVAGEKEKIGDLQKELTTIQDENDTRYNALMDSIDFEEIRQRASEDLGMEAATADQIVNYDENGNEYMEQYGTDGMEASSDGSGAVANNY